MKFKTKIRILEIANEFMNRLQKGALKYVDGIDNDLNTISDNDLQLKAV